MLFTLFICPIGIHALIEIKTFLLDNEFQTYSFFTSAALTVLFAFFCMSLWQVVFTHFKHKYHPLILRRFDFLFSPYKSSDNVLMHSYIPILVSKRVISMLCVGLMTRYTIGPLIIMVFVQGLVSIALIIAVDDFVYMRVQAFQTRSEQHCSSCLGNYVACCLHHKSRLLTKGQSII